MSLAALRNVLQTQVSAGQAITVSAATLTAAGLTPRAGLDVLVRGHLVLGENDLTIGYTGDIPAPAAGSLTVPGTASLLGVTAATVTVAFLAPSDTLADVRVAVELPAGWTLGTAFDALAREPFSELTLTGTRYVVTTRPQDGYTWNGTVHSLSQGSQLLSLVTLDGPLAVAASLLTGGPGTAPLTGVVDPSGLASANEGIPVLALSAPLGGSVAVPHFSLSVPKIELATMPATEAGLLVWLAFATTLSVDGSPLCDFKARIGAGGGEITFVMSSAAAAGSFDEDTMTRLINVPYQIPDQLSALFQAVTLRELAVTISAGDAIALESVEASIGSSGTWHYGQFSIEDLRLGLMAMAPLGTGPVLASFQATANLFPGAIDGEFEVEAFYDVSSGDLNVTASIAREVALSKVVSGLSNGQVRLPDGLDILFSDFGVSLHKPPQEPVTYTLWGAVQAAVALPFLGGQAGGSLQVVVDSAAQSYQLIGGLVLGDSVFGVTVDLTATDKTVSGKWEAAGSRYLGIDQLAEAAGLPAPPIPGELDLNLKSAELTYQFNARVLAVMAESVTYGKAALVAGRDAAGHWGFVFGVLPTVAVTLDLTTIDVIGKLVPSGDDIISLSNLRIVGASDALPAVVPPDAEPVIGPVVNSGLMLSAELKAGTAVDQPLTVRFGGAAAPLSSQAAIAVRGPGGASPAPQALWINVQRSFGPVHFERVGFTITSAAELSLLLDAAVSVAGLTVGLTGLQASMPIRSPYVPSFDLAGLQVRFNGGGVAIGGGLEKVPGSAPPEYTGELTVQLARFGVTMFGSYTTANEQPSLYAFLFLDAPLGGPAFFFVTGLAGGFGYNRSLQLPDISGVADYPLVAGAMGTLDAQQTESQLKGHIQVAQNENWLAAGVRFTSFETVKSFALLTVAFGTHVEIALLGESTISVPVPARGETVMPVARADMVVTADLSPSNGQLAVCAQLTPQSWVLDPAARLTGGFAFYAWFAPSAQPGDFVVTLGGYNPYFTPPSYYPQQVPRLGLSWQLPGGLSISGGLYFALTPSVLMAGGYLRATWQSGDISAWFDAQADFLMRFKPFSYGVEISISIGASFTINLLVTTLRITIYAGVSLRLWGPPFGGTAQVHLSVISFTIGFGAGPSAKPPTLSWRKFRDSFLPPANSSERQGVLRAPLAALVPGAPPPATPTDSLVTVSAAQGLLGTVQAGNTPVWIVSPASLRIVVTTQVPSTSASVQTNRTITPSGRWTDQLGVGPMGAGAGALRATLTITIARDGTADDDSWAAVASTGGVPKGLYLDTEGQMQTDGTIRDALLGVTVTPAPPSAGSTLPVPVAELLDDAPTIRDFGWSAVVPPDNDSFDQDRAMDTMRTSLAGSAGVRADLLAALRRAGLQVAADVDVGGFAEAAPSLMASPPQLRLLGEQPPPAARTGSRG